MKKSLLATMVTGLSLLCVAPVMALDVDVSGEFRLRGVNHDNIALSDPKSPSQAWYDSRFRIRTTFKINNSISLITRFDTLDNRRFGTQNTNNDGLAWRDYKGLDVDIAYVVARTPYGAFLGGRMLGSQWGPSPAGDSSLKGKDRLMWSVPLDRLSFGAYLEKHLEHDSITEYTSAGADRDKYTAFIQHRGENLQVGLLASLYDYRSVSTMRDMYYGKRRFRLPDVHAKTYVLDPYVSGTFGPFSCFAEGIYMFGEADYNDPAHENILVNNRPVDIDALMYHLEGKYRFGPAATLRAGYWFMSGDSSTDDNKMEAVGYLEDSLDMDTLLILTGNPHELGTAQTLGGMGNFSANAHGWGASGQGMLATAGARVIYVALGLQIMDNLHLGVAYGNARADRPPGTSFHNWKTSRWSRKDGFTSANFTADWDDDVGNEYDFTLRWTPIENLEYKIMGGYLDAGDFWKQGGIKASLDSMYTLFHALTVTF